MNKYIRFLVSPKFRFNILASGNMLAWMPDKTFLKKKYRYVFHKKLNLETPKTYNEKVQWLKLYDRKSIYTAMVDKYEAKKYVADRIGEQFIIPTLGVWNKFDDIDFDALPKRFVLKCTHDSGGLVIVRDKDTFDRNKAKKIIEKSLRRDYYQLGREWPYKNVKPRIIAEQYMEDTQTHALNDYKFYSFNGTPKALLVVTGRQNEGEKTRYDFFDMDYKHMDIKRGDGGAETEPSRPRNFELMKQLAAELSQGIPHVRVDFYEVDGKVYFGELTFAPRGGFGQFEPQEWDEKFGSWIKLPQKIQINIPLMGGGGAERVVAVWASELYRQGYDVSIMAYARAEDEYVVDEGVAVHVVAPTYADYKRLNVFERIKRMRKIMKENSPAVMISFLPRMQIWAMAASRGIKTYRIETVRNNPWKTCEKNRMEKMLWNECFRLADAVILQTEEQGEYFSGKIRKKCAVIPNPVDQQYVNNHKTSYNEHVVNFVAAGRITPQKNYPLMIEAFGTVYQQHKNLRLSIFGAGEPEYVETLKHQINAAGLSGAVTLEGRTKQLSEELCRRDVFLMTSDYEGMPNALIEAMASGLVCISTDCKTGPADLIVSGENGFLVKAGDVAACAQAIEQTLAMNADKQREMGNKARSSILTLCSEENSYYRLKELIEKGVR